jgi:hypothetical protein
VLTFDARLGVGAVTTQVEVKDAAVELNRTSAEIGGVNGAQGWTASQHPGHPLRGEYAGRQRR